ncbi:MAG: hypothetical protein CMJ58_19965 [Planctomycetaceae bacterium]|nr:hypothetical protein [Planctomycetaceae bacterium]
MFTPTRTPEGEPNCCSVCGASFDMEPSLGARDAPCPCCGSLCWFAAPAVAASKPQQAANRAVLQLLLTPPRRLRTGAAQAQRPPDMSRSRLRPPRRVGRMTMAWRRVRSAVARTVARAPAKLGPR